MQWTVAVWMVWFGNEPEWVDPQPDPDRTPPVVVVASVVAVVTAPLWEMPGEAKWTTAVTAQLIGVFAPATLGVLTNATVPALTGMAIAAVTINSFRIMFRRIEFPLI